MSVHVFKFFLELFRKSILYTLFLDGSTLFMNPAVHLTLFFGMQANRDLPCQNQHNDTRAQQKLHEV